MVDRLRAERFLLTGDLSGLKSSEIRRLALIAWEDKERADRFASQIVRQRLENVER